MPPLTSFNSATAVMPWKTFLDGSKRIVPNGFNSATAVMPWKTPSWRSHRPCRWLRFNSATAVMPWKTGTGELIQADIEGFNSATAVMPWKTPGDDQRPRLGIKLQFGHGGDAVENVAA